MTAPYNFKSDTTELLRKLRASISQREKKGWSRNVGAGFIKEDIKEVTLIGKKIKIEFNYEHIQTFDVNDLNLREQEELVKYLEIREQEEHLKNVKSRND